MSRLTNVAAALVLATTLVACGDAATTDDTATVTPAAATPAPTVEADDVVDRVEVALANDSTVRRYGLDADDDDNRVVLKGTVRTEAERAHAQVVAGGLAPGLSIDNRIRVDVNVAGSDTVVDLDELEEQIENAIQADSVFRGHRVDVDEDNGRILLEGKVPAAVKTAAEALARRMAGTVEVVSRITTQ